MISTDFAAHYRNKTMPMFLLLVVEEYEMRVAYINRFVEAHSGKPIYRDELTNTKQPRTIGKKPVIIVVDWDAGVKKPSHSYMKTNTPTLLVYTKPKVLTETVKKVYGDSIFYVHPRTGQQVTIQLQKLGIPDPIIAKLKEKTSGPTEAVQTGIRVAELSKLLGESVETTFATYFWKSLQDRNIDEEPTEFLSAILDRQADVVFDYLSAQRGNEFFVYASILNWLEDIIKFCSCNGDYWEDAGLVAAKYRAFQEHRLSKKPYIEWIRLYQQGLRSMQSIKLNESEPMVALEVFVCSIMQTV